MFRYVNENISDSSSSDTSDASIFQDIRDIDFYTVDDTTNSESAVSIDDRIMFESNKITIHEVQTVLKALSL